MEKVNDLSIKIFISYSWKPTSNKVKVINLAERLTNDGIHVIIDDWDLKEGQDKYHFMEQMVNDPSVSKVLLICNCEYSQKANDKTGGVGIESLIISNGIYTQVEQTKFIPIVMEYDINGKPYLPSFVDSRIFIDLGTENEYEENYEKLLRNLYEKPKSKRPPIGKMPVHLIDDEPIFLPTAHKIATLKSSLTNNNPNAHLLIKDYLETFTIGLLDFKICPNDLNNENFIDKVEKSISSLQILKNDFIDFVFVLCKYSSSQNGEVLFDFLENLIETLEKNDITLTSGKNFDALANDNFKFFLYDLYLSLITILIKYEKFDDVFYLVKNSFIIPGKYENQILNFVRFQSYNYTLNEFKNLTINPKRVSVVADKIKQYATILNFSDLREADLLLYYLSLFYPNTKGYKYHWLPETTCYSSSDTSFLSKIISFRYFEKIKIVFGVKNSSELKERINDLEIVDRENRHSRREYYRIPLIKDALHYNEIGMY